VRRLLNAIKANSIANRKPEKHEINNLRRAAHALAEIAKQGACYVRWTQSRLPAIRHGCLRGSEWPSKAAAKVWDAGHPHMAYKPALHDISSAVLCRGERRHGRERGRRRPGRRAADALHAAPGAEDGRQHLATPAQVRSIVLHVVVDSRSWSMPGPFQSRICTLPSFTS